MIYILRTEPTPKASARHGKYRVYDGQRGLRLIQRVNLENQHDDRPMLKDIPLKMIVTFHLPMPVSWSNAKRKERDGKLHTSKPDTSNMTKWIEDLCTQLVYYDDCLIAQTVAEKRWASDPRTEFTIVPCDE